MLTRLIQNLLFDAGELAPSPRRKPRGPLTPEERAWRRKARQRARRRQRALFQFAARKPKKRRRRRRSYVPKVRTPRDPSTLKRQPKPLASPLYNLPAALVDDICLLNLRNGKHLRLALYLAEQFVEAERRHNASDPEAGDLNYDLDEIKRTIRRIAEQSPRVRESLDSIQSQWEALAAEVRSGWSANHEKKANNYHVEPMEYEPQSTSGLGLELNFRDVIE